MLTTVERRIASFQAEAGGSSRNGVLMLGSGLLRWLLRFHLQCLCSFRGFFSVLLLLPYDSDKLDSELRRYGIELIAPHRMNRKNTTQDLRRLRRYRRRWKIERLFAWLRNFRRLVVRYERYAENFLGMLYLGCCLILLRYL